MSDAGSGEFVVVAPGLSTTVQDYGRVGWQRLGVPVSGALDRLALAAANITVGNPPHTAGLECLYQGPELALDAPGARIAVAGAGAVLEITEADGSTARRVPALESMTMQRGQQARVKIGGPSISAYLAVEGGIAVPEILGSRSTYARAALGGLSGRTLAAGDVLPLEPRHQARTGEKRLPDIDLSPATIVRVVLGPQDDHFTPDAIELLGGTAFTVLPASDRMGLRLGGARLPHRNGADIVSDGIPPGAIQVPGDGQPIVMLADRQTTGGYTKIATVISADLPSLGRVGPGAVLRFALIEVGEAEALARAQADEVARWPDRLQALADPASMHAALYEANLISGVVDGLPQRAQPAPNV